MSDKDLDADVVIVGAGIAGVLMAKHLAQAGLRVLILEAGTGKGLDAQGYQSFVETYQAAMVKVPNSAYPNNPNAPQPTVADTRPIGSSPTNSVGYFVQAGPHPFASTNTRTTGGTTLHWLGTCLRMLPSDFRMKELHGHGVDWPIAYQDLVHWYGAAEQEIGVSADVADQRDGVPEGEHLFPRDYVYPMRRIPPSKVDDHWAQGTNGLRVHMGAEPVTVRVVSTPQGRNSTPEVAYRGPSGDQPPRPFRPQGAPYASTNTVGERCEGNASCIPICPVQAKYTAARTLVPLTREHSDRVRVQVQSVASAVETDSNGMVTGIITKRYASPGSGSHTSHTVRARAYVLAASAIENARLMLASNLDNTSGQLGANLMDHPTILTWGRATGKTLGSYRGPGSTSGIPSFRAGPFRSQHAAFRIEIGNWGWNWATGAPNSVVDALLDDSERPPFGRELRRKLYTECQSHVRLATLVEQTPLSRNRVGLNPRWRDALGNLRPVLHYDFDAYTQRGMRQAVRVSKALFQAAGIQDDTVFDPSNPSYLVADGQPVIAYGAGHIVGTHRMGTGAHDSVTDSVGRVWKHRRLWAVGCGLMPTIGTSNPTLTLAALSLRSAHALVQELA